MDKKFLGIRIGTFVLAAVSLIVAVVIWFYVEYEKSNAQDPAATAYVACDEVTDEF